MRLPLRDERSNFSNSKNGMKKLAMIVAASKNDVIGVDGDLPWHLSADLKRFKKLTMGHHIIMGRKTFDSIGRLLPGRTTVIVTRQADFQFEGALTANTIDQAIELAGDDECPFIVGGAQIYELAIERVTDLMLTRVDAEIEGDTFLPAIDWAEWKLISSENGADAKLGIEYAFEDYVRPSLSD